MASILIPRRTFDYDFTSSFIFAEFVGGYAGVNAGILARAKRDLE